MKPFRSSGQSFNEIPLSDPKKSSFDLSYTNKGSGKIGRLIPVSQKECLPGDRISCDVHSLLRFEPLAVPLLSDMNLRHHQYFVPFRQVWSSFESFITGGKDGYSDSHVVPSVDVKFVLTELMRSFSRFVVTNGGFVPDTEEGLANTDGCGIIFKTDLGGNFPRLIVVFTTTNMDNPSKLTEVGFNWLDSQLDTLRLLLIDLYSGNRRQAFNISYGYSLDEKLYTYDIVCYNVAFVINKFKGRSVLEGLDHTSSLVDVSKRINEFMLDIYSLIFDPFVGPGSNWDYLGYPVNFWNRNGYNGLEGVNQSSNADSPSPNPLLNLNWSLYKYGNGTYEDVCSRGTYTPYLIYGTNPSNYRVEFWITANRSEIDNLTKYSVLPLRALYRIWYFNYRDQNLEAGLIIDPDSADFKADTVGLAYIENLMACLMPRCVAWSKDTFTTATLQAYSTNLVVPVRDQTETQLEEATLEVPIVDLPEGTSQNATIKIPTHFVQKDNSPLASISGLTLSNLRKVQALARWLDKNLFVGFQYADQLFSHYNVKYSDARLQIPEYLAGNSEIVRMEVITNNTTIPGAQTAGDQVARAQGLTRSSVDGYFIEEHGLYFALMSVLPDQSYPFGVDRSLLMTNKFDIAFPEFAQLGSDIVNTGELYADIYKAFENGAPVDFTFFKAFGYQGRYYHYKYNRNEQHGELNTTRREWTFARFFDKAPVLDANFIHCTPNLQMFVSPYSDQFVYDVLINLRAQRSLPVYDQVL